LGDSKGCGKGVSDGTPWRGADRLAEALRQEANDLLDLNNLFCGGKDKRGETFPGILTQEPKAMTGLDRGAKMRIIRRESVDDSLQLDLGLEIMGEPGPIIRRSDCFGGDAVVVLFQSNPTLAYYAFPTALVRFPAKGLARVERHGQVVVSRGQRNSMSAD
jgi:hypothetical protein